MIWTAYYSFDFYGKFIFFSWRILDILSKERKLVIHLLSTR